MPEQSTLIAAKPRSMSPKRLRKPAPDEFPNPERVYMAAWKRLNRDYSGRKDWSFLDQLAASTNLKSPITQRDHDVAATVIQWLGTNFGLGFLMETEKKIRELKDEHAARRRELWEAWHPPYEPPPSGPRRRYQLREK